jgi:hypothetical protein
MIGVISLLFGFYSVNALHKRDTSFATARAVGNNVWVTAVGGHASASAGDMYYDPYYGPTVTRSTTTVVRQPANPIQPPVQPPIIQPPIIPPTVQPPTGQTPPAEQPRPGHFPPMPTFAGRRLPF